jgi:hypothetical protein
VIDVYGTRPVEQMLSRVVRITLGGETYELPVRSMRANREWKEQLDAKTASLIATLGESGNDPSAVLAALSTQPESLLEMLISYDSHGILPSKQELEDHEPDLSGELVAAVREVWRAASPLVVTAVMPTPEEIEGLLSSPPTNTSPTPTAGNRKRSRKN